MEICVIFFLSKFRNFFRISVLDLAKIYYEGIFFFFYLFFIQLKLYFSANGIDYMTMRLWIGLWSSLFCIIIVAVDGSAIVRYIETRRKILATHMDRLGVSIRCIRCVGQWSSLFCIIIVAVDRTAIVRYRGEKENSGDSHGQARGQYSLNTLYRTMVVALLYHHCRCRRICYSQVQRGEMKILAAHMDRLGVSIRCIRCVGQWPSLFCIVIVAVDGSAIVRYIEARRKIPATHMDRLGVSICCIRCIGQWPSLFCIVIVAVDGSAIVRCRGEKENPGDSHGKPMGQYQLSTLYRTMVVSILYHHRRCRRICYSQVQSRNENPGDSHGQARGQYQLYTLYRTMVVALLYHHRRCRRIRYSQVYRYTVKEKLQTIRKTVRNFGKQKKKTFLPFTPKIIPILLCTHGYPVF